MKTAREKYMSDPQYKAMVDMLESYISRADFSPSEIREMAILACINYEMRNPRPFHYPVELEDALDQIHKWTEKAKGGKP